MKIKDLPKIDRPREKLVAKGAENLKDSDLLAILLRTGSDEPIFRHMGGMSRALQMFGEDPPLNPHLKN